MKHCIVPVEQIVTLVLLTPCISLAMHGIGYEEDMRTSITKAELGRSVAHSIAAKHCTLFGSNGLKISTMTAISVKL